MGNFYDQRKLRCGGTVNSYYYNPYTGTKGSRIATEGVCSVYYFKDKNVDKVELMRRPEVAGKNPLPLFRYCFDINIQCPTTKWQGNIQQKQKQNKNSKKRLVETLDAAGKRKVRKLI